MRPSGGSSWPQRPSSPVSFCFPPARELFHFGPLHGDDVTVALAAGLISLLLLELAKRLMQPFFSVRHPQTGAIT